MIGSNAFNYINVLNKAANATLTRYDVIANNIANNDTPNYKRQDVQFESYLKSALSDGGSLDKAVDNADLNSLDPTIYTDNADLSYRLDGNNVDMETEQTYLADSQIRYYALLDSMSQEFGRIKTVLSAR